MGASHRRIGILWHSTGESANRSVPSHPLGDREMPTYQYRCKECGHDLEIVQSFSEDPLTTCPECEGALKKVYGNVGISFKGSGFYKTDSRGSAKKSSSADKAEKTDTGSSSSDTATKSETSTSSDKATSSSSSTTTSSG
jgi:putative FmdB family regulatory protein